MPQDENLAAVVSNAAQNAAQDIGSFIRTQREAAQVSVRQLAEKAGVSNPYLSQIERGLRKPSADVLQQIAKALRVSAEVLYVRAGILETSETSEVRDAIETHLRHEPTKLSKSRIKRLRGLRQPQYRLRVGEVRVFYDVTDETVEILAIITKAEATRWLAEHGTPDAPGGVS